ncbi:MAG: sigma-70 family RNA polymerase sigma factor [Anaerolinea sp.]|nr:sigma-70 family RNA polymerase sigma factor [Anaerolinea sp.]
MSDAEKEADLVARLQAGDKSAYVECVELYGGGLYRLALRLMQNEADAEDVVQEAFMNAYRAIGQFEGRAGLGTWLYRITYNAAMMRLRTPSPAMVSIDESLEPDGPVTIPSQLFDWCCLPESDFETNEVRDFLEANIQALPETLKTVFVLREIEGLSTDETAQVLDISTDAVKKRLHRGRLWLRERLTAYFSDKEEYVGIGVVGG